MIQGSKVENYYNPVLEKRYRFILDGIKTVSNGKTLDILDIGCGVGNLTYPIAKMGHNVIGIDNDKELIRQCIKENTYGNAFFYTLDAESIKGFPQCDLVICCEVLEHMDNPQLAVSNMYEILKPNGMVLLSATNGYSPYEFIMDRVLARNGKSNNIVKLISKFYCYITGTKESKIHPFYIDSLHKHYFSYNSVRGLFSGFKVLSIQNSDIGIFIPGAGRMAKIKKVECKIADYLPHFMVGGWMMVLKKCE